MRLPRRINIGGSIAAFFFFSWIIMLLWNSLVAGHLGLAPTLSYLQAAGLWFLVTLLTAWTGIGVRPHRWYVSTRSSADLGDRIEREIKSRVLRWAREEDEEDLGDRVEAKIKHGFAKWVGADPETDWDDLGERIEERIKQKVRDWVDE